MRVAFIVAGRLPSPCGYCTGRPSVTCVYLRVAASSPAPWRQGDIRHLTRLGQTIAGDVLTRIAMVWHDLLRNRTDGRTVRALDLERAERVHDAANAGHRVDDSLRTRSTPLITSRCEMDALHPLMTRTER